jgi:hypothetical protein
MASAPSADKNPAFRWMVYRVKCMRKPELADLAIMGGSRGLRGEMEGHF